MINMAFLTQEEAQFSSVPPASEFRNGVNATIHDDDAFRVRRHWERFPVILLDNPNACGLSVSIKSKLSLFSIRWVQNSFATIFPPVQSQVKNSQVNNKPPPPPISSLFPPIPSFEIRRMSVFISIRSKPEHKRTETRRCYGCFTSYIHHPLWWRS